jgi:hypothetical protein
MTKMRRASLIVILLCSGLSIWWGCSIGWSVPGGPMDFQAVYYGSKTLIQHHDPYHIHDVEHVIQSDGPVLSELTPKRQNLITLFVNTPVTLLFVAPFALLPLAVAQVLWSMLVAGSLIFGAFLMWDISADSAPVLSACLVGFLLLNCQIVIAAGNTAAIVVGLCIVATWCFIKNRLIAFGIVCMAVSLMIKPHDAGFVWLYFLLINSVQRKRAIQTAVLTALFAIPALIWIWLVIPNWLQDWRTNLAIISAPGGLNDPRPLIVAGVSAGNVISLQAVFSIFNQNPSFYNLASYIVCGVPILLWIVSTLRSRSSPNSAWFAMAAIVPLTMLITYHRVYDAKLLLLTVPACAMLWSRRDAIGRTALILTSVGFVLNADVPLAILTNLIDKMHLTTSTLTGKLLMVILARPNQEILLAMGLFYLWVYVKRGSVIEAFDHALDSSHELTRSHT